MQAQHQSNYDGYKPMYSEQMYQSQDEKEQESEIVIGNTKVTLSGQKASKRKSTSDDFLVNTDPECLRFKANTADMKLLDKVIMREISIVDHWQNSGYVDLSIYKEDENENENEEDIDGDKEEAKDKMKKKDEEDAIADAEKEKEKEKM